MQGQISGRLQDLNSVKLQLKPCADDAMKFEADSQLKQDIATSGAIVDVVTHAGRSTVTMEHGLEGVMYNTLCGQSVKFTIIAKEQNGRKRTEGGDLFTACCINGTELEFLDVRDCEDGTYTFSYTPTSEGQCKLVVKLMGLDVRGSPFSWSVEYWHLLCISGSSEGHIQLSDQNMTARYKLNAALPLCSIGIPTTGPSLGSAVVKRKSDTMGSSLGTSTGVVIGGTMDSLFGADVVMGGAMGSSSGRGLIMDGTMGSSHGSGVVMGGRVSFSCGSGVVMDGTMGSLHGSGVVMGGRVSSSCGSGVVMGGTMGSSHGSGVVMGGRVSSSCGSGVVMGGTVGSLHGSGVVMGGTMGSSCGRGVVMGGTMGSSHGSGVVMGGMMKSSCGSGVVMGGTMGSSHGSGMVMGGRVGSSRGSGVVMGGTVGSSHGRGVVMGGTMGSSCGRGVVMGGTMGSSHGSGVVMGGTMKSSCVSGVVMGGTMGSSHGRGVVMGGTMGSSCGRGVVMSGTMGSSHGSGVVMGGTVGFSLGTGVVMGDTMGSSLGTGRVRVSTGVMGGNPGSSLGTSTGVVMGGTTGCSPGTSSGFVLGKSNESSQLGNKRRSTFGGTTTGSSALAGSGARGVSLGSPQGFGGVHGHGSTIRPVSANRYPYVVSSICFNAGKHLCKAELKGNIQEGFSFGFLSSSQGSHGALDKLGNWWLSKYSTPLKNPFSLSNIPFQQSTINHCTSNDIIEMYLDCDDGTLMMYNQRTEQSDMWHEVKGDVCPMFHMMTDGDQVSLLL